MVTDKKTFPSVGDTLAIKLRPGLWGCCRVIKIPNGHEARQYGTRAVLVVASRWVGMHRPTIEQSGLRDLLYLTHHSWTGSLEAAWVDEPPSTHFKLIGQIPPTKSETRMTSGKFNDWCGVRDQILTQWRWDNERKHLELEDQKREAAEHARITSEYERRTRKLTTTTLEQLVGRRFLPSWTKSPMVSADTKRLSRKILRETVNELLALGVRSRRKSKIAVLQKCIEAFNTLNETLDFIETSERDDLCEEFKLIVHACGLHKAEDIADAWRNW
jgi:hypothetical protein